MTIHKPYIMQSAVGDADLTYTAQEIRMGMTAAGLLSGQGVLNPADWLVTQRGAGANFSVDVAAGMAGVTGDDIAGQGLYLVWNDAVANVVTPGAPGSGTRIHRLVLQIRDKLSNGTYTTYDAILSLLQDTGTGTPAEPASALTLALVSITAGAVSVVNANITDKRPIWQDAWNTLGSPSATGYTTDHGRYRFAQGNPFSIEVDVALHGTSGSGTAGTYTFANALPAAYRPAFDRRFPMVPGGATTNHCTLSAATGVVSIIVPAAATLNGGAVIPLD